MKKIWFTNHIYKSMPESIVQKSQDTQSYYVNNSSRSIVVSNQETKQKKPSKVCTIDSLTFLYTVLYVKSNPHNTYTLTILIHYNHFITI